MAQELDTQEHEEEKAFEQTLRPKRIVDYVGQDHIKQNLHIFLSASKKREDALEHTLLYGPAGLGKTTLAHIIAHELEEPITTTSGPALERVGDIASILTNLEDGGILFIDEIHRLNRPVEEVLYPAMEDFLFDIVVGKGPSARTVQLQLPRFTLVGATTRVGMLSSPFRSRFGVSYRLDFYTNKHIEAILSRSARILGITADKEALASIAQRARQTPRVANRLLKRVRDYSEVEGDGTISKEVAETALDMLNIDARGLERMDRIILETIANTFNGGPVGLQALSASISEEQDTIADVYEPYLMQAGFIIRTPKGRMITQAAYQHLSLDMPDGHQERLV